MIFSLVHKFSYFVQIGFTFFLASMRFSMFQTTASLYKCPFTSILFAMQVLDLHFEWHMNTNMCCVVIRSLKCITHNSLRIIMHNSSLNPASKHLYNPTRAPPKPFLFILHKHAHIPSSPTIFHCSKTVWVKVPHVFLFNIPFFFLSFILFWPAVLCLAWQRRVPHNSI